MGFSKKRCQSGMDSLEFAFEIEGMKEISFDEDVLKNKAGKSIVIIKCSNGRVSGSVNAVHCIRNTNEKPFTLVDSIKMAIVRNEVFEFIRKCLKDNLKNKYSEEYINNLKVTSLEVNVTRPCVGKATPTDMAHLFDMVFDNTKVYRERKLGSKCEKVNTGVVYEKKHEYQLKIYDKSKDMHRQGIPLVPNALFRLEVVFKDRKLNSMFGQDGRTLDNVLSTKALDVMCREYKTVLEEIITKHIRPYLKDCVELLYSSLTWSDSGKEISDTIARYKDCIVDLECLRKALQKWYNSRGVEDRSKQMIHKYRNKNLNLPEDVWETLKIFYSAAG